MNNKHINKIIYIIYDILAVFGISFLTTWILKDENYPNNIAFFNLYVFILVGITIICLIVCRLYRSIWRYASVTELLRILTASVLITIVNLFVVGFTGKLSNGWSILYGIAYFNALCLSRFFPRVIRRYNNVNNHKELSERVMIVGAGDAANYLIKELLQSRVTNMQPCCIVDDDTTKKNIEVDGIKIVGTTQDIPRLAVKYAIDVIIISIPSTDAKSKSRIIRICQDTKCKIKIMPSIYQMMNGQNSIRHMRGINLDDLNEREKIQVNNEEIYKFLKEKTVLICGAGSNLGQKLSLEIAKSGIKKLILFDISEDGLLNLKNKLLKIEPLISVELIIGSVLSVGRLKYVFETFNPEIVYNLPCNNKVDIIKLNENEVVKNNIIGTKNLILLSDKYQVKNFFLINYSNVESKENIISKSNIICEKMMASMSNSSTKFAIITCADLAYGKDANISRFNEELIQYNKITIDVRNEMVFLLSEEEIVSLILETSHFTCGNDLFVFDLSDQEKIYDLALKVVKVLGYNLNIDAEINITNKFYHEVIHRFEIDKDKLNKTNNNYIYVKQMSSNKKSLWDDIEDLSNKSYNEVENIEFYVDKIIDID